MGRFFLDVTAAFESLRRFYVFGDRPSDENIAAVFRATGFGSDIFREFCEVASGPSAFAQSGVPAIIDKLIAASHSLSWYSFEGLDEFVLTQQGSKPGDPLGDIVFAFLISKVLKHVICNLCSANLNTVVPCRESSTVLGEFADEGVDVTTVNYVDDNACFFMSWAEVCTRAQQNGHFVWPQEQKHECSASKVRKYSVHSKWDVYVC